MSLNSVHYAAFPSLGIFRTFASILYLFFCSLFSYFPVPFLHRYLGILISTCPGSPPCTRPIDSGIECDLRNIPTMGVGAILEPLVVVVLLFGGTWINRRTKAFSLRTQARRRSSGYTRSDSPDSVESGYTTPTPKDGLLSPRTSSPLPTLVDERWRTRQLGVWGLSCRVTSPNTVVFQDRLLSRLLQKLPFLAECWYWALVYWVRRNPSSLFHHED